MARVRSERQSTKAIRHRSRRARGRFRQEAAGDWRNRCAFQRRYRLKADPPMASRSMGMRKMSRWKKPDQPAITADEAPRTIPARAAATEKKHTACRTAITSAAQLLPMEGWPVADSDWLSSAGRGVA